MAKRRRAKRRPIFPLILLLAFLAVFLYWSNTALQVERFTFADPALPPGFEGCTVVLLSDLHGAEFGASNEDLLAAVRTQTPDYIFLTGDLLDRFRETGADYAVTLCAALNDIAPTYMVTGNHEWALGNVRALKKAIAATGATVLTNEFITLERYGSTLLLAGVDDPNGFADQKTPAELAVEIYSQSDDPYWFLLAHRNNYFKTTYRSLGAALTLSGHAHGGLFRFPGTDGLIGVERDLFPTHTAGFYEVDGARLFVTRGLGNSGRSFRLFNRPQVAVLTLTRG